MKIIKKKHLPEYGSDFVVKAFTTVSHIEDLQSFLDSDSSLEGLVVHEELDEVEKLAWFETSLIGNAAFIHSVVLVTAHIAIEVIIYFLYSMLLPKCVFCTQMMRATSDLRGFCPRKRSTFIRSPAPIFYLCSAGFLGSTQL